MKNTALTLLLITLSACIPFIVQPAAAQPITADSAVEQESISTLEALDPVALWHEIDGMDYWAVPLDPPEGYYDDVDMSDQEAFRRSLHELIEIHTVFAYSTSSRPGQTTHIVDTWDIVALADAHPEQPNKVLDIYLNGTFDRQLKGVTHSFRYDREHSWPKSHGFKKDTKKNPAYSDCHHLFAAYQPYNASRSNKPYGKANTDTPDAASQRKSTLVNLERGGGATEEPESSNYSPPAIWQTWIGRRGDVARALFYLDVRYDGHVDNDRKEADLQLTPDADLIDLIETNNDAWKTGAIAYMGLLDVLLAWHEDDPVDDLERRRNTVVYLFQRNRNPFIDHPEWVEYVFGDVPPPSCNGGLTATAWINEFHYDNAGTDTGEFVEIAGSADLDLTGWRLYGYNGKTGRIYREIELSGVIDNENASGYGAVKFDFPKLQNGSPDGSPPVPDGIALVDASGSLRQFLSYEGTFSAGEGPANDEVAKDVDVRETGNTPAGHSLQLRGEGASYGDFHWAGPATASPGELNEEQQIQSAQ